MKCSSPSSWVTISRWRPAALVEYRNNSISCMFAEAVKMIALQVEWASTWLAWRSGSGNKIRRSGVVMHDTGHDNLLEACGRIALSQHFEYAKGIPVPLIPQLCYLDSQPKYSLMASPVGMTIKRHYFLIDRLINVSLAATISARSQVSHGAMMSGVKASPRRIAAAPCWRISY